MLSISLLCNLTESLPASDKHVILETTLLSLPLPLVSRDDEEENGYSNKNLFSKTNASGNNNSHSSDKDNNTTSNNNENPLPLSQPLSLTLDELCLNLLEQETKDLKQSIEDTDEAFLQRQKQRQSGLDLNNHVDNNNNSSDSKSVNSSDQSDDNECKTNAMTNTDNDNKSSDIYNNSTTSSASNTHIPSTNTTTTNSLTTDDLCLPEIVLSSHISMLLHSLTLASFIHFQYQYKQLLPQQSKESKYFLSSSANSEKIGLGGLHITTATTAADTDDTALIANRNSSSNTSSTTTMNEKSAPIHDNDTFFTFLTLGTNIHIENEKNQLLLLFQAYMNSNNDNNNNSSLLLVKIMNQLPRHNWWFCIRVLKAYLSLQGQVIIIIIIVVVVVVCFVR